MHKLYFSSSLPRPHPSFYITAVRFSQTITPRRPSVELQEITLRLEIHLNEAPRRLGMSSTAELLGEIKCNDYLFSDNLHEKLSFPRDVFHDLTFFSFFCFLHNILCALQLAIAIYPAREQATSSPHGEVWKESK